MQTTEQIMETIRGLPVEQRAELRRQLAIEALEEDVASSEIKKRALLSLCGSVDIGGFRIENPDREWIYGERRA